LTLNSSGSSTSTTTRNEAIARRAAPAKNGYAGFILYSQLPAKNASSEPTPPMKLMMPLAWLLRSDGVMSGMKAMTGERKSAMEKFITKMTSIMGISSALKSGIKAKVSAAGGTPAMM